MIIQGSSLGLYAQLASHTQKPGVLGTIVSVMPQDGCLTSVLGRTPVVSVSVPMRIEHLYSNNKQHSNQEKLTCGRDWINLDPCREVEGRLISILTKNFLTPLPPVISKRSGSDSPIPGSIQQLPMDIVEELNTRDSM